MSVTRKKQKLRYAADRIIDNPRRRLDGDSHLDVPHLKQASRVKVKYVPRVQPEPVGVSKGDRAPKNARQLPSDMPINDSMQEQLQQERQSIKSRLAKERAQAENAKKERRRFQEEAELERERIQRELDEKRRESIRLGQANEDIQRKADAKRAELDQLLERERALVNGSDASITSTDLLADIETVSTEHAEDNSDVTPSLAAVERQERVLREQMRRHIYDADDSPVIERREAQADHVPVEHLTDDARIGFPAAKPFSDQSHQFAIKRERERKRLRSNTLADEARNSQTDFANKSGQSTLAADQPEPGSASENRPDIQADDAEAGLVIPMLGTTKSGAIDQSRVRTYRPWLLPVRSIGVIASFFLLALVGSSLSFFGFLNFSEPTVDASEMEMAMSRSGNDTGAQEEKTTGDYVGLDSSDTVPADASGESLAVKNELGSNASKSRIQPAISSHKLLGRDANGANGEEEPLREDTGVVQTVLRGRIISAAGEALPDIAVSAIARRFFADPVGSPGGMNYRTRTNTEGVFLLHVPEGDEYRVVTEGNRQFAPSFSYMNGGEKDAEILLQQLGGALSVSGRIFTESLDPVTGVKISTEFVPLREVFSDTDGVYAIEVLPPTGDGDNTLVLRFESPGYQDGVMHLPAEVWEVGQPISHDVFLNSL